MEQVNLFTVPRIDPPNAPADTTEPRLWIRRFAIYENPEEPPLREVLLKTGLNIVWSPDLSSSSQPVLAHGSGKTTFCRLLRGCLGEPEFAAELQSARISQKLPKGFMAAEIRLLGVSWVVVRYFSSTGRDFVKQTESIEEALNSGRQSEDPRSLDQIIQEAFFQRVSELCPSEIGQSHIWDVFRAWLSRDQECRLANILDWRSAKTQSRSRAQTIGELSKLHMVRIATRALDAEELKASEDERRLSHEAEEERRHNIFLEKQRSERLNAVRQALGVGDLVGFDDTIDEKSLVSLAEDALRSSMSVGAVSFPDIKSFLTQIDGLSKEKLRANEERQNFHFQVEQKRGEAERLRSEAELGEIDISQNRIRVCGICKVPVDEVLASQCKISLERCNADAIRTEINRKKEKAGFLDKEADIAASKEGAAIEKTSQVEAEIQKTRNKIEKAQRDFQTAREEADKAQDRIYHSRRLLDEVRDLQKDLQAGSKKSATIEELELVRLQMEQGRKRSQVALQALEDCYRGILTAWLPQGVDGSVKLSGKRLSVDIQFNDRGEVSTAALDSLKIVAFDLAILHLASEGKADIPAFLIHDSPREADLDGMLYARLFELIHQWDIGASAPCFQYIVTTTTAPPGNLQGDDFVKLKMASTPESERLFRKDL